MRVITTPDHIVVESFQKEKNLNLIVDRHSASIRVAEEKVDEHQAFTQTVYGVLGVIRLLRGNYLILITGVESAGSILGHEVLRVTRTRLLPFSAKKIQEDLQTEQQRSDENTYLELLDIFFSSASLYFSRGYDLTNSYQRSLSLEKKQPMWKQADERFFWNRFVSHELIEKKADDWIVPTINGFVESKKIDLKGKEVEFAVVSRISCKRAGTRYTARGVDAQGNPGNNAETEQLVSTVQKDTTLVASFVQTRGSIPLSWKQLVNLKYTPRIQIDSAQSETVFAKHMTDQLTRYGRQILISLLDQKGQEFTLNQAFEQQVAKMNHKDIRYIAFDFHKKCANMKWENLKELVDSVGDEFEKMGYVLHAQSQNEATTSKLQQGVFRTNCLDCLDRTNVVQSLLARRVLEAVFVQWNILSVGQSIQDASQSLDFLFKNVWADNADALSLQYAGTPALKTEYTRTGKRTSVGAAQDLVRSATRYVLNNFRDGSRQDALDLFLGRYVVTDGPSPFAQRVDGVVELGTTVGKYALVYFVFILFMGFLLPVSLTPGFYNRAVLFFAGVAALVSMLARTQGRRYANKPLFSPLD